MRQVLAALLLLGLLTGCASTATDDARPSLAEARQSNGAVVPGYGISIPRLGVTSTLQALGMNPDRTIAVPSLDDPMQAGVYANGPMPGEIGPTVVLAHVNAGGKPGFGAGFYTLRPGDEVDFTTPGGSATYRITRVVTVPKSRFPTEAVYGDVPNAQVRLITCGPGELDASGRNYVDQTIAYGAKV